MSSRSLENSYTLSDASKQLNEVGGNFVTESSLRGKIDSIQSDINTNNEEQTEREKSRTSTMSKLEGLGENRKTAENTLQERKNKESSLSSEISKKESTVKNIDQEIEILTSQAQTLGPEEVESQIKTLQSQKETLTKEIKTAKDEREKVRAEIKELDDQIKKLNAQIKETDKELQTIVAQIEALKKTGERLAGSMSARTDDLAELREVIQRGQREALEKQKKYQLIAEAEAIDSERDSENNGFNDIGIFPFTTRLAA